MLLQIMDDGRLTDAKGRKVDFRNTIIIMTSNVGAELIRPRRARLPPRARRTQARRPAYERMKDKVLTEMKKLFRPEFLNRIDAHGRLPPCGRADPPDRGPACSSGREQLTEQQMHWRSPRQPRTSSPRRASTRPMALARCAA